MAVKKQAVHVPFRFKLQKVLDYREQLEEEAKAHLAQCEQRLQQACAIFDKTSEEIRQAEEKRRSTPLMDNADRWLHEQYIKGLHADLAQAALQKRMQEQLVDEARQLLAVRAIDKKLLEKLKERHRQQYLHEASQKEQRVNDETATLRYKTTAL